MLRRLLLRTIAIRCKRFLLNTPKTTAGLGCDFSLMRSYCQHIDRRCRKANTPYTPQRDKSQFIVYHIVDTQADQTCPLPSLAARAPLHLMPVRQPACHRVPQCASQRLVTRLAYSAKVGRTPCGLCAPGFAVRHSALLA